MKNNELQRFLEIKKSVRQTKNLALKGEIFCLKENDKVIRFADFYSKKFQLLARHIHFYSLVERN
jgi:hypothetical protein